MSNQTIAKGNIQSTKKISQDQEDIETQSRDACSYHELGDSLLKKGLWQESVKAYRHAIELNPNHYRFYYSLGFALAKLKLWDEVFLCQEKVAELNPNFWEEQKSNLEVQLHLGEVLRKKQRWQKAIEVYLNIVRSHPDFHNSYFYVGFISMKLENWQEALDYLDKSIELSPGLNWNYYYYRGEVLVKLEKWEEAIIAYQQALEIAPHKNNIYRVLGDSFARQGKVEEASSCYLSYLEIKLSKTPNA